MRGSAELTWKPASRKHRAHKTRLCALPTTYKEKSTKNVSCIDTCVWLLPTCEKMELLAEQNVFFEMALQSMAQLLLLKTKPEANQRVNVCFNTSEPLLFQLWSSLEQKHDCLFPFSRDYFGTQNQEIMRQRFCLTNQQFVMTCRCFRQWERLENLC